jgi:hypothetical protein
LYYQENKEVMKTLTIWGNLMDYWVEIGLMRGFLEFEFWLLALQEAFYIRQVPNDQKQGYY